MKERRIIYKDFEGDEHKGELIELIERNGVIKAIAIADEGGAFIELKLNDLKEDRTTEAEQFAAYLTTEQGSAEVEHPTAFDI